MFWGEVNQHPIQLLVNYWEISPSQMGEHFDGLVRRGATHVASFMPWQVVESDISHRLMRFLQAAAERKVTVSLIITPELGIHYTNSGLPKDLISRNETLAQHAQGGPIIAHLPPNGFQIPSLFSPEFSKRYYSYLSRVDSLLGDFSRNEENILNGVTLVLTGSFWKYYRSAQASCLGIFGGIAGDFSNTGTLAYRQRLEQFYSQREFLDPSPAAANRWKNRSLDEVNRRWFYQQSEEVFRVRTAQMLRRKVASVRIQEIELFTPEADPGFFYSSFLQTLSGAHAQFSRLSSMVDEMASRASMATAMPASPFMHWSAMGGFKTLADQEKQFLFFKSLLLMASRRGGIFIDESEWFALSASFRSRAEALARSIGHGELELVNRALYFAPHLWSSSGILWEELGRRLGPGARMVSSLDLLARERNAELLIVDPGTILTRETVLKLMAWVKPGRTIAIPRSPLFTESARAELEATLANTPKIEMELGVSYRLHALGEGKIVLFDLPDGISPRPESLVSWQKFIGSILSLAQISETCRVSDSRITVIPLKRKGSGRGLFLMNSTRRPVSADVLFPEEVKVSDLAIHLAAVSPNSGAATSDVAPAARFSLQVPPYGILPLSIDEKKPEAQPAPQPLAGRENILPPTPQVEGAWS